MKCTYRACPEVPTRRTKAVWDAVWWYGCPAHIDAMIDAMYVGNGKIQVEDLS